MTCFSIEPESQSPGPRAGVLSTGHGQVRTPAFMPVGTYAAVKGLTSQRLEEMGAEMILANAYHLAMRPGEDRVARLGGLHRFMGWNGPILTDSGGYQVFSLAEARKVAEEGVTFRSPVDGSARFFSPEGVIEIQAKLGSDVVMPLDECPSGNADPKAIAGAVERTLRWARRSAGASSRLGPGQILFGIVQGGADETLRKRSVEGTCAIEAFRGLAVGGLSVGEDPARTWEAISFTSAMLPADRPRYLMGMGRPQDVVHAIGCGFDLFDCVLPTRNARNAQVFTSRGTFRLRAAACSEDERPIDPECDCETCRRHSRAYLRHLFLANDMNAAILATIHNVAFYLRTVRDARAAILAGRFAPFRKEYMARQAEGRAST